MRVTTQLDLLKIDRLIHLVCRTQLVMTDHLGIRDLLPPGLTQKVLRLDGGIAQESGVCHHGHVVLCRHVIPSLEPNLGVVHLFELANGLVDIEMKHHAKAYRQRGGDDAAEAIPVLEEDL